MKTLEIHSSDICVEYLFSNNKFCMLGHVIEFNRPGLLKSKSEGNRLVADDIDNDSVTLDDFSEDELYDALGLSNHEGCNKDYRNIKIEEIFMANDAKRFKEAAMKVSELIPDLKIVVIEDD